MWETLKEACVGGRRPGTLGYIRAVNFAANLFVSLQSYWKKGDAEAFNKDDDVGRAILQGEKIKKLIDSGVLDKNPF